MDQYYQINDNVNGYSILRVLGEGRYGIAYLAMNDKQEKFVIKQLKKEMLEQSREKLYYEEMTLRRFNNPRFPKFIGKFQDDDREGYILEYIEGPIFYNLLTKSDYRFDKRSIYRIAGQLLELEQLLQDGNIVHRDIRLPNVILMNNNELALIDFGLARPIDHRSHTSQIDYWYIGDFLLFLYYSNYQARNTAEKPWYQELDISNGERHFIKQLLGINGHFHNIEDIRIQLEKLKSM